MKDIYLMRHGETIFNYKLMLQGWCDAPLTPNGISQAHDAKNYFNQQQLVFDNLYVSPLKRAIDTLKVLSIDKHYIIKYDLKEWGFGLLEGENQKLFPNSFPYGDQLVPFYGEAQNDVQTRINRCLYEINDEVDDGSTTLVVMHTCVMRLFMHQHNDNNYPLPQRLGNCAIIHYQVDGDKWNIVEIIEHN